MKIRTLRIIASIALIGALSGCMQTTQTTSGKDYISKYAATSTGTPNHIEEEIRNIANVEPLLQFPARIGLAKIHNAQICNLTEAEASAWNDAHKKLGKGFGDFIPVSPLIAEMVYTPPNSNTPNPSEVVRKIRMGAARQHLDAVLIYEVFSETSHETLPSAVANWTIIGAYFVPSEKTETVGYANALLVDVRNGYPYGTATATATKSDVHTVVTQYGKQLEQQASAQVAAAINLTPEVVDMFGTLQSELWFKQSASQ